MFKHKKNEYLEWKEYKKRIIAREKLVFMQNTVLRSLKNHFEKMHKGVTING